MRVGALPAYELRRGAHPRESVEVLRELLSARGNGDQVTGAFKAGIRPRRA
jgi:hypothetical protein